MNYKITDIKPDYVNHLMDVTVNCGDEMDVTVTVKNGTELVEFMQRHDQFLSDLENMRQSLEADTNMSLGGNA